MITSESTDLDDLKHAIERFSMNQAEEYLHTGRIAQRVFDVYHHLWSKARGYPAHEGWLVDDALALLAEYRASGGIW